MTATTARSARPGPLPLHSRLLSRLSAKLMPPRLCEAERETGLEVALADGVNTRADHYVPLLPGRPPRS
jgi:hypothetical protein